MMYGYYGGPDFFPFMHILNFIFWIVLIVLVFKLFKHGARGTWWREHDSAMTILKERYAKGEISKEEFEERRKELMK